MKKYNSLDMKIIMIATVDNVLYASGPFGTLGSDNDVSNLGDGWISW